MLPESSHACDGENELDAAITWLGAGGTWRGPGAAEGVEPDADTAASVAAKPSLRPASAPLAPR